MNKYSETSIADMRDLSEQELKKASGGCGPRFCGGDGDEGHGFGLHVNYQVTGIVPGVIPVDPIPGCFHGGCRGGEWGRGEWGEGFRRFDEERFFRFHHRRHCGC